MLNIPAEFTPSPNTFDITPFHRLIQRLRDPEKGCPWDIKQTLQSIAKSLLEESNEAADALRENDSAHQCEELGDVLLNVMLAVVIAEEENKFTWGDVLQGVTEKLIRRHPHVFGEKRASSAEEALKMFLEAKAAEKNIKRG